MNVTYVTVQVLLHQNVIVLETLKIVIKFVVEQVNSMYAAFVTDQALLMVLVIVKVTQWIVTMNAVEML